MSRRTTIADEVKSAFGSQKSELRHPLVWFGELQTLETLSKLFLYHIIHKMFSTKLFRPAQQLSSVSCDSNLYTTPPSDHLLFIACSTIRLRSAPGRRQQHPPLRSRRCRYPRWRLLCFRREEGSCSSSKGAHRTRAGQQDTRTRWTSRQGLHRWR